MKPVIRVLVFLDIVSLKSYIISQDFSRDIVFSIRVVNIEQFDGSIKQAYELKLETTCKTFRSIYEGDFDPWKIF